MGVPSSTLQSGGNVLRAGSVGACVGLCVEESWIRRQSTMVDQLTALLLFLMGLPLISASFQGEDPLPQWQGGQDDLRSPVWS